MLSQTLEFFLCIIEVFSIYFVLSRLLSPRFGWNGFIWLAALANALLLFLLSDFNYLKILISLITVVFFTLMVFNIKIYVASLFSLMFIYVFYVIDVITGTLFSIVTSTNMVVTMYDNFMHRLIICLIVKALDILAFIYIYYQFKEVDLYMPARKVWLLFNFVILVFTIIAAMVLIFYAADMMDTRTNIICLILSVLFFVMSMLVIHFLTYILKSDKNLQKLLILNANYDAIQENLELQKSSSIRLNKIRHDMKNHLALAHALLQKSDNENADRILLDALSQTDSISLSFIGSSGNSIIDAIVASKSALCDKHGINFEYYLDSLPEISIDAIDISSVLSNMLDNAIEAARKTSAPEIVLKIVLLNNNLNIFVRNTFNGKSEIIAAGNRLLSSKKNSDMTSHGYGMMIINEIAAKYSGSYEWYVEGNIFCANVFLNTNSQL